MRSCLTLALLACCASGCAFGMTADKFAAAKSPAGLGTELTLADARFVGELIEVRDAGIVVLTSEAPETDRTGAAAASRALRLIPFTSVSRARFVQLGAEFELKNGRPPSAKVRERLRLLSRYPYGLSPMLEAELLKAYGQASLRGAER